MAPELVFRPSSIPVSHQENRLNVFAWIAFVHHDSAQFHEVAVLLTYDADNRFQKRMPRTYELRHWLLIDVLLVETDALEALLHRCTGSDQPVTFPYANGYMCNLEAAFLPILDAASEMLEGFHEEALNVMRLQPLRFCPLHLQPNLFDRRLRHHVVCQLALF